MLFRSHGATRASLPRAGAAAGPLSLVEDLPNDRHRRRTSGRHLGDRAPPPRRRLRLTHEPLASPLRFKPPAAGFLIKLVQHAGPLRPGHVGLDLPHHMPGARQDRDTERAGSRQDVAAVSSYRSDHRPGLRGHAPRRRRCAGRIASRERQPADAPLWRCVLCDRPDIGTRRRDRMPPCYPSPHEAIAR